MSDQFELPPKQQAAYEAARLEAELAYETRGDLVPHRPEFASSPLHSAVKIQKVYFAYCREARNACRERLWTVTQVRKAITAEWDRICDSYSIRKNEESRAVLLAGVRADAQWMQHVSELKAFADRDHAAALGQSRLLPEGDTDRTPAEAGSISGAELARRSQEVSPAADLNGLIDSNTKYKPATVPVEGIGHQPPSLKTTDSEAASWADVSICLLDAENAQVSVKDQVRQFTYAEMGFGDRRGVNVGDRGPKKSWGWLQRLAEQRGIIDLPERQSAPVPQGPRYLARQPQSSHEALIERRGGAAKAREELQVAMKDLRRTLCSHFGIKDSPIVFEQSRYCARFRIGRSGSYTK